MATWIAHLRIAENFMNNGKFDSLDFLVGNIAPDSGSSLAHTERTQSNHIFAAIFAYVKLEELKLVTKLNHFALKTKVYIASMKTAMISFQELWKYIEISAFA